MTKRLLTVAALAAALLGAAACDDSGANGTTTATSQAVATSAAPASGGDHTAACAQIKGVMDKAATEFLAAVVAAGGTNDPAAASKAAQSALQAYGLAAENAGTAASADPEVRAALMNLQTVLQAKSGELASIKDKAGLEKALNDPALNKAVGDVQALCP